MVLPAPDPGGTTIPAGIGRYPRVGFAMTAALRIVTTARLGERATLTVGEDLNRADAERLRAHLEVLSRAETCVGTYAGERAQVSERTRATGTVSASVICASVTVCGELDRVGAERLRTHLAALVHARVRQLWVDLTSLASEEWLLAWTLGSSLSWLAARAGSFTVVGARPAPFDLAMFDPAMFADDIASSTYPHRTARVPAGARAGQSPYLDLRRPETADQP